MLREDSDKLDTVKQKKYKNFISISSLNSSKSYNSQNSIPMFDTLKSNKPKSFSKKSFKKQQLETLENANFRTNKEDDISNDNIRNNSLVAESKYFFDDISTKTINTCSIKDEDEDDLTIDL